MSLKKLAYQKEPQYEQHLSYNGSQTINNFITRGRFVVLALVTLELLTVFVYLIIETVELSYYERAELIARWLPWFGWCFFSLSFALFLSVYFLIDRLCRKRDQVTNNEADRDFFNGKIRTLLAILIIFSSTYMLRGVWDLKEHPNSGTFVKIIEMLSIGILCDFVPIMFIMVFHYKNFFMKIEGKR